MACRVGEAIHIFLGADNVSREQKKRLVMAGKILKRWQVAANLEPGLLLLASERLEKWSFSKWPNATWHREYPVALRQENGTIVSGFIDLLLQTPAGFVIIDHKSFPGSQSEAQLKAAGFAGQLGVYEKAVKEATGQPVLGSFVHLPVSGMVVQINCF